MQEIKKAVDKHKQRILDAERWLWAHPETGYKEWESAKYMTEAFESLGYNLVQAGDIPGFYTVLDTGKPGPTVLILSELDSIICPTHPEANPKTGAVHSCGHNAQGAAMIGIASALKEPGILEKFCGKIKLCAVPAEELLEIEYRKELKQQGVIRFFGGKSEFLRRGYFDDVDMAFMVHTSSKYAVRKGSVGCVAKRIVYKGKAAHAGGAPHLGKNALYAAMNGLNAVNAIRETFQEKDLIRVHPILTDGGQMVNAIPETATLESYVRGATFDGIISANKKVNQALCGAALSMDNNVDITDFPGYAPMLNSEGMVEVAVEAAQEMLAQYPFAHNMVMGTGSTDMGDLSSVMPVVHPYAGGSQGTSHGSDYYIVDPVAACVDSAKWQLGMLYLLCADGGKRALEIKQNYKPPFDSIAQYLAFMDSLERSGDRIAYHEDGTATVRL